MSAPPFPPSPSPAASAADPAVDPSTPGLPRLSLAEGRATITLNRPQHHNRLHPEDLQALQQHFQRLQADPTLRVLVITAEGRSFCSGFHLGSLGSSTRRSGAGDGVDAGPQLFEQTVDALEALPVPTVCRLNGGVYGGAIDLALACDFRVGLKTMQARMPAARIGLHYYPSGLQRYVSRLGLSHAKRLFLLAETLDGQTLQALGVLDHLAEDTAGLDAETERLTQALLAGAPLALRGMKSSLNEIARGDWQLSAVRARVALCARSQDLKEGMAAMAEQRSPRFEGR